MSPRSKSPKSKSSRSKSPKSKSPKVGLLPYSGLRWDDKSTLGKAKQMLRSELSFKVNAERSKASV